MGFWGDCCCGCGWGPDTYTKPLQSYGYSTTTLGNDGPDWYVNNGLLTTDSGDGSIWKTSPLPKPSWNQSGMVMQAAIWQGNGPQEGVFIGNARVLYADWSAGFYFSAPCDLNGNLTARPTQLQGIPKTKDTVKLAVQGGGPANPGLYTIKYIVNDFELNDSEEQLVSLNDLDTMAKPVGGMWTQGGGSFAGASFICGIAVTTSCCPAGGLSASLCCRMVNRVANLECSDVTWEMDYIYTLPDWMTAAGYTTAIDGSIQGWSGTSPAFTNWPEIQWFITAEECFLYFDNLTLAAGVSNGQNFGASIAFTSPCNGAGDSPCYCYPGYPECALQWPAYSLEGANAFSILAMSTTQESDFDKPPCTRDPLYINLGHFSYTELTWCPCEGAILPLVVSIIPNPPPGGPDCSCFGVEVEVTTDCPTSFNDNGFTWGPFPFQACDQTWNLLILYLPIDPLGGNNWYGQIVDPRPSPNFGLQGFAGTGGPYLCGPGVVPGVILDQVSVLGGGITLAANAFPCVFRDGFQVFEPTGP